MLTLGTAPTGAGATPGGQVRTYSETSFARRTGLGAWNAAGVVALTLLTLASLPMLDMSTDVDRDADAFTVVLVLLAAAATAVRGRWPLTAAGVVGVLVGTYLAVGYPYGPMFGFAVLTVYTAARHRPPTRSGWVAVAAYLLLGSHVLTNEAALDGAGGLSITLAWVAIPYTFGVARRLVVAANARERLTADQRLVDAERLRLSQEVHDVVGHGLAAIQMQADITLHLSDPPPEQTRAALQAISQASGAALDELRTTLGSVHGDASRAPTPGLARAEELCRRVRDAGLDLRFDVTGDPRPLPTAADVAAYRVLQESLTNVLKHSAHPHADVHVVHTDTDVTVEVTNTDVGPEPVDGIGITGMRRRVAQVGGTLRAGPGPRGDTFQVRATIPRSPQESS